MSLAMKAVVTYDCKCGYCGRSLTTMLSAYESKPTSKRELNIVARAHASFHFYDNDWKYYFWMMIVELTNEK